MSINKKATVEINAFEKSTIKPKETEEQTLERLAGLTVLEYDRAREKEAENLGIRVSILDKAVNGQRQSIKQSSVIEELEPHNEPVILCKLLEEIKGVILRHAVLPVGTVTPLVLWIASTYSINQFSIFPKLVVYSPEKRCGKSTVLDLVDAFSNKALFSSNVTPAVIFRVIDKYQPTLIIDEADTFITSRQDDMVGIINSGHAKSRAKILRADGEDFEPKSFSTWAPMAFGSINSLQGTIMDRSITIKLKRKLITEKTARLSHELKADHKQAREKLLRWTIDNKVAIKANQITPPSLGNDRAVDNWIPLFTIAKLAGEEWLSQCEESYKLLSGVKQEDTASTLLLKDIRDIFKAIEPTIDLHIPKQVRISSKELVDKLIALEERPWVEWKRGQPMTQNSLVRMLKDYGIASKQLRIFGEKKRGYELEQFTDTFTRYLDPLP